MINDRLHALVVQGAQFINIDDCRPASTCFSPVGKNGALTNNWAIRFRWSWPFQRGDDFAAGAARSHDHLLRSLLPFVVIKSQVPFGGHPPQGAAVPGFARREHGVGHQDKNFQAAIERLENLALLFAAPSCQMRAS